MAKRSTLNLQFSHILWTRACGISLLAVRGESYGGGGWLQGIAIEWRQNPPPKARTEVPPSALSI
jgi:hypothetical protein